MSLYDEIINGTYKKGVTKSHYNKVEDDNEDDYSSFNNLYESIKNGTDYSIKNFSINTNNEVPDMSNNNLYKSIINGTFENKYLNKDRNVQNDNIEEQNQQTISYNSNNSNNSTSTERKNGTKNKEEIDKQIRQVQTQTVTTNTTKNTNNVPLNTDTRIGLANQNETQNAQKLTTTGISSMQKANEKNENINKGGIDKFNEFADTVLNNIYGGAKQTAAGLVDVVTTIAGFGIRGLEGSSKIIGLNSTADKLNEIYNNIVNAGSDINETANYESTINSQVKNDLIKTSGNVANVISNMISSQLVGYATGINGTIIQGLSVGGNSAQEVLNKNKDNIGQATLTGIAKGYTSYLTERMFDANILTRGMKKTSIQEGINRLISNKISSEFGKELANKTVGIIGENIEELVEDNAGYLIDKLINNEDLPSFQQWWNNTTETARITTLSTFIMGLMGLGGQSFKDIENDMETQYWIEQAEKIIEKENLGIHFNTNEVKDLNTIKDFYITRFTPDGEISNIVPTKGITIENTNQDLNVTPVIVRDNETSNYNIIDGNTGIMLDSTYYQTRLEAEQSYNEKVNKLSDLQIKDINKKINEANYMITDKIMNIVNQAKEQLQQTSNLSQTNNINYNNSQQPNSNIENSNQDKKSSTFYSNETNYAVNDIKKVTEPFGEKKTYTKNELADIWNNNISDNEYDVIYDSNGDIQSYIAIEEEGNNLVVNQYDNQDNVIKSEIIPENNGKYTSEAVRSTIEKVASIYDKNKPIKGQVDIEGNEVRSMKKDNKINNTISHEELSKSIERFKNAKGSIDRQDIINIANSLNIKVKRGAHKIIDVRMQRKSGHNLKPQIVDITKLFENVTNNNVKKFRKQAMDKALELYRDEVANIKDTESLAEINRSGIKETYSTGLTKEKIQSSDNIKEIIEEGIYDYTTQDDSDINKILYHHYFSPVNYEGTNGLVRVVIKEFPLDKTSNDKFYYHQIEYISENDIIKEGLALSYPTINSDNKTVELEPSNINNSITQKTESVKNDKNTVTNSNMQNNKNNTSKKQNGGLTKVEYDSKGRELTYKQSQFFKDSKVRDEKGNLKTVYHGTDTKFTVFNYDYLGKNGTANGKGFYLADDINVAKSYSDGKNIIEAYVDIQKPLSIGKTTITENDYIKFLEAVNDKTNGVLFADYGDGEKIQKNSNKYKEIINQFKEEYNYGGDDVDLVLSILNSANITLEDGYRLLKNTIGYDGIIVEADYKDNGDTISYTQYIPLTPEQIKKVDNFNPTSNQDIRFAKRSAKENNIRKQQTQRNAERSESYIEQEIQKIEKTGNWDDSIPVTKLTDIRRTIENYLGLGIQKGHFRQQAYGIYKTNRDVLRTKELKDMDTILHETGHAMDLGNRIKIDKETIADELLTAISKTGGYENESRQVQLDEGFAEIIREYSIVPDRAKAEYPQTVAVLEGIRQNDKSFDNFITKVQQQTYNYIHQNPRNRTLSNVSIGEQTDKPQLSKEYIKQEVMRNIYDKDYALKAAVNELNKNKNLSASDNAYYLTRLSSGIGDKVISMLSDGYIDENGNKLMPGLNKIGEILGNNPERFNDLRAYLVAKRDVDYKAKTLKTGIRTMDSNAVIEQFKNDSQIQEASKLVYDTLDGVLQYVVNNHLIDQETANKIKESNAFYVPMQRVFDNQGNNIGRRGAVADVIKARTGSELDVKDVLENIIANSSNMIQQVENNNILRALYKEGESSGLTGAVYDVIPAPMTKIGTATLQTWENELKNQGVDTKELDLNKTIDLFAPNNKVDSKNLITSFIDTNGKRIYLQFYDELLFNSVMNMDKEFMSKVLKISRKLNMPLRYGATMANLGFAIPNMISDTAQATIYSTAGFIPVVDNAIGIIDVLAATNKTAMNFLNKVAPQYAEKINAMYTLYQQTGATSSTRMSQYRESTQNLMKDVYGTKDSQTLGIQEKYKPLKRLLDILTYIPELSEQSTRFRVFERNYDYYKNKGTSEMDARIMAALESRDATQDFGRTGNLTREINQLIPFSAARVGSIYTFAEKVKANPKQVGMRIAVLTAIAMTIKAIGYDDDEIEELNQRKKDDNFVLKIGDNIVTIKKPQGILRSMINFAEYIQDLFTGHIEEGKEGERLVEWINNTLTDNLPAESIPAAFSSMPGGFLLENAINKDLYYNTDIVKSYDLDLPNEQQYYDYNSQLAILLGKALCYSPAKIDNAINGMFGGLGTTMTNIIDYISGKIGLSAEEPNMGAEENTIGKRFIVNVNSNSASLDEMYNRKTELTKKSNSEEGLTTDEKEELERLTNAISNISKINKQIKEIKKDLTMSGKEKAEQIKLLQHQKTDMARESLEKKILYEENKEKNESIQFYTTSDSLKKNGYTLSMTSEMKKEYEQIAYEYYSKYESQGLYSKEKLEQIKSNAKDYAKNYMFSKYKSNITKTNK